MTTPGNEGRFAGYDVLSQMHTWDDVTSAVVLARMAPPRPLEFFSPDEAAIARPLVDRLLGQDTEPRIDVLADIDGRLARNETDGWHYADMPPDGAAWQQSLRALDSDAHQRFNAGFAHCTAQQQAALIQAVQDLRTDGDQPVYWHDLPASRVWSLWTRYACSAFYAHPWAWNEIGFGGPAYPRGYKNLGVDAREPWERPEIDAVDPVPWSQRTEAAQRAHLDALGQSE